MVAIAKVGFHYVENQYAMACGFRCRNGGRLLSVESDGGGGDLTGLYQKPFCMNNQYQDIKLFTNRIVNSLI